MKHESPEVKRSSQWARLTQPELPGRVRPLGYQAAVTGQELTRREILQVLGNQVSVDATEMDDGQITQDDLIIAFRAGFRSRRLGPSEAEKIVDGWRAIREGHHLQRASFRAGAWFYDEIFPDHVVRGSWVEVFGFTAQVKRVSLGLPTGCVASRMAADRRYAYVVFQFDRTASLAVLGSPRAEWVPFSELQLVEHATTWPSGAGCRTCGAEPGSAVPSAELPQKQMREPTPYCCGCCGAPWFGAVP